MSGAPAAGPPRPRRRLLRDAEGLRRAEEFAVAAVVTILTIRAFLAATGYPKLGGAGLHIAHMLWGGLGLAAALLLVLVSLDRTARVWAAVLGGAGFGFFVDEIGKFVTSDHDYFYRPAFALMYGVFVALFVVLDRAVGRRPLDDDERIANAAHLLGELARHDLDAAERARALAHLERCDPRDPRVAPLRALAEGAALAPAAAPGPYSRARAWARRAAARLLARRGFVALLVAVLAAQALWALADAARLGAELWDVWRDPERALGFGRGTRAWAALGCSAVAAAFGLAGAWRHAAGRPRPWAPLRRGLLVSLLGTQFLRFHDVQVAAVAGLAANLALLGAVEFMMRRGAAPAGPPSAPARTASAAPGETGPAR
uniref:Uncharacterized protein n=1 Tax=Eiseniibacteriota bacterium TaxID=2212470 RepID=A0A832I6I6_UNCEI